MLPNLELFTYQIRHAADELLCRLDHSEGDSFPRSGDAVHHANVGSHFFDAVTTSVVVQR